MVLLYIDPGTGSMLFSLIIGIVSVLFFGLRKLYTKLRYLTPGRAVQDKAKKGIVIYSEDKRYWTTFKGILDEFEQRQVPVTYLAGSEDDPLLQTPYEYVEKEVIGLGNKAYAKLNFLNARICLATTPGLDVYQWKKSKNVDLYVHIIHATGSVTGYNMFGTAFYDSLLLSSAWLSGPVKELETKQSSAEKEIEVVGCPYMDYLLERRSANPTDKDRETISVLLAPSWGKGSIFNRYGTRFIDMLISTGYDITIRPHPQSYISEGEMLGELMRRYPETSLLHWNRDADNFAVLEKADILISDYSGILLDFSFVFDKPVIYADAPMEFSTKDQAWLDTPYWMFEILPKIGILLEESAFDDLKTIIFNCVNSDQVRGSIAEARNMCWEYRGEASRRVVDYLVAKSEGIKASGVSIETRV